VAARCFHTLTTALIALEDCATHGHTQTAVVEYLAVFDNRQRCHAANGDLAPLADEQALRTHGIVGPERC
jgi:hypothetical protein